MFEITGLVMTLHSKTTKLTFASIDVRNEELNLLLYYDTSYQMSEI